VTWSAPIKNVVTRCLYTNPWILANKVSKIVLTTYRYYWIYSWLYIYFMYFFLIYVFPFVFSSLIGWRFVAETCSDGSCLWATYTFIVGKYWCVCVCVCVFVCVCVTRNRSALWNVASRGGVVGWGSALQTERSRVRFPMASLEIFIDIIPPAALWSSDRRSLLQKRVPGIFSGGKGGRCVRLATLPPSCADGYEIWEPQPPGTLTACPGL
jgi:hypothetical protein